VPGGFLKVVILQRCLGSLEVLQGAQNLQQGLKILFDVLCRVEIVPFLHSSQPLKGLVLAQQDADLLGSLGGS
jgi:hypothetical protein